LYSCISDCQSISRIAHRYSICASRDYCLGSTGDTAAKSVAFHDRKKLSFFVDELAHFARISL
jgi:hypothetical protein